jgi:hypothetical protein
MNKKPAPRSEATRKITAALKRSGQQAMRRARVYGTGRLLAPAGR